MDKLTKYFLSLVGATLFFLLFTSSFPQAEETKLSYVVIFKSEIDYQVIDENNLTVQYEFPTVKTVIINSAPSQVEKLKQLEQIEHVYVERTFQLEAQRTSWAFEPMKIPIEDNSYSGKGVKIAVLDTGISSDHPDLNVVDGVCVLRICPDGYQDDNGHGTHVAGIIAAKNNNIGTLGVAPDAEIYAIKALDRSGDGLTTTIMAGIQWAIENNMDIVNLSLTTTADDPGLKRMIDQAYENGILIVAAAGNNGSISGLEDNVLYPARYSSVIGVGALSHSLLRFSPSATGSGVEVTAPGDAILSTIPTNLDIDGNPDGYMLMSGTSMAAPHIAGLLAIYKEQYPSLNHIAIRELLQKNALDLGVSGKDSFYGYGLGQYIKVDQNLVEESGNKVALTQNQGGKLLFEFVHSSVDTVVDIYRNNRLIRKDMSNSNLSFEDYVLSGSYDYTFVYKFQDGSKQSLLLNVKALEPVFKDLTMDMWFAPHISYLYNRKVITGRLDGTVTPNQLITRGEAVAMLGRALGFSKENRDTHFKDVGKKHFASGYIQLAFERGILNGFPDGTFRPEQHVTRAEMAILLTNAYLLSSQESTFFSDVNEKVTGYKEINQIAQAGITKGYPDGTFKPSNFMARSSFAVFMARAENDIFKE